MISDYSPNLTQKHGRGDQHGGGRWRASASGLEHGTRTPLLALVATNDQAPTVQMNFIGLVVQAFDGDFITPVALRGHFPLTSSTVSTVLK